MPGAHHFAVMSRLRLVGSPLVPVPEVLVITTSWAGDAMASGGSLWAVVAVIGFSAIVQFATGFGFALTSVPLLTLVIAPHQAVLLALLVGTFGNVGQMIEGRRLIDRRLIGWLFVGAIAGLPLGWWIFVNSNGTVLQITIGVITLVAVAALARGVTLRRTSRRIDLATGVLSGALTTCTGTNGPPIVAVLHARRVSPPVFRATTATTFVCLDSCAVAFYIATRHIDGALALTAAATVPAIAVGAVLGIQARRLLSPKTFRILVLIMLTLTGVTAIASAG